MSSDTPCAPATAESISRTIGPWPLATQTPCWRRAGRQLWPGCGSWYPSVSEVFVNTSETLDAIGYTEYMHGNDRYINLHDQMMSQPDPAS